MNLTYLNTITDSLSFHFLDETDDTLKKGPIFYTYRIESSKIHIH